MEMRKYHNLIHKFLFIFGILFIFGTQCRFVYAADVASVSTGYGHTAIVLSDGTLWMCGLNESGQLGDGTTENKCPPVQIMTGVKAASAGYDHTAIIKKDGSLWMCGSNKFGRIGAGTENSAKIISSPMQIMTDVKTVSAGKVSTAILKNDGTLWMCGDNTYGGLGDGTMVTRFTPVQVMSDVKAVDAGLYFSAILKNDGSLWVCGYNEHIAVNGVILDTFTPVQIMTDVADISAADDNLAIIKEDGSLWMSGYNSFGQYGDGTTTTRVRSKPIQVMTGVKDVDISGITTAILKTDGTLWMCGKNDLGQLGDGSTTNRSTPFRLMSDVKAVSTGAGYTTAILKTDGSLWMCGENIYGQYGNNNTISSNVPVQIVIGSSSVETEAPSNPETEASGRETESANSGNSSSSTTVPAKPASGAASGSNPSTAKTYTVSFDPTIGKLAKNAKKKISVTNGKKYEYVPDAVKSGYALLGWFTKKKGGAKITENSNVSLSKNTVLYAHWVKRISIKKAKLKISSCIYNGKAQKPGITVTVNKKTLVKDKDFSVSFKNNKNASKKASVTIKGKGLYKDSITKKFTIKPRSITDKKVTVFLNETTYNETKKKIKPEYTAYITVDKKKQSLKAGTDFTVSYSNNVKPGNAKAVFKGKGNYTGKKKLSFVIFEKVTAVYKFDLNIDTYSKENKVLKINPKMKEKDTKSYTSNQPVGKLPVPTSTDYDFLGWFTKKKGGNQIISKKTITAVSDTKDKTLYAHWKEKVYKVKICADKSYSLVLPKDTTYERSKGITLPEYSGKGYTYNGWSIKGTQEKNVCKIKKNDKRGDLELYPTPIIHSYTIVFEAGNGGTVRNSPLKLTCFERGTLPKAVFTPPTDKTFDYWLCNGKKYEDGASVQSLSYDNNVTFHFVAQWKDVGWAARMNQFIKLDRYKNGDMWGSNQSPLISDYDASGCRAYAADFVAYVYGKRKTHSDPKNQKYDSYIDNNGGESGKIRDITKILAGDIVCCQANENHLFVVIKIQWDENKSMAVMTTAEGNVGASTSAKSRVGNYYRIVKGTDGSYHLEELLSGGWRIQQFNFTRHYGNVLTE